MLYDSSDTAKTFGIQACLAALTLAVLAACNGRPVSTNAEPTAVTTAPALRSSTPILPPPTAPPTFVAPATLAQPTTQPSATSVPPTPTAISTAVAAPTPTRASPTAAASRHTYVFPVRSKGKVNYGKAHHDYPATDIFCSVGSEFLAVTDGVVDYVSREDHWDAEVNDGATRGGLSVAIIGDDEVRYYGSHLSQVADGVAPGVRVTAGQVLGLTGHSGDAAATPPHLHFGISHPTNPDDWATRRGEISPYPYLRAWQKGESMAPKLP